jgi:DNA-binding NtrC family response regulator
MSDILIVDDDLELVESLARVLSKLLAPHTIRAAESAGKAVEVIKRESPLVVILDLCIDERVGVESGFNLLKQVRVFAPQARVLVLTGHGTTDNGVKAMQLGAASFIEKPANPEHLAALIKDGLSQARLKKEYEKLKQEGGNRVAEELCGESLAVAKLRDELAFAASTAQPVLLLGETGTGKGLCAKIIHQASGRCIKHFVHYHPNYGGGDIVQSELFGHRKGAFTGAVEARRGLALEADGGTLFIDELDSVPKDTQVMLLDLTQEQRIRPVGADSYQKVDCRLIAATNRPISEALREGLIRQDLYHRLASNVITLPPLRERSDDIPVLIQSVLRGLNSHQGINVFDIDSGLVKELQSYNWPGNIRELRQVVETGAYRAQFKGRAIIECGDIALGLKIGANQGSVSGEGFHERVEAFKRQLISDALKQSDGNQLRAAEILGIDRGTVKRLSGD